MVDDVTATNYIQRHGAHHQITFVIRNFCLLQIFTLHIKMAEQDRYGSHLGVDPKKLSEKLPDKSSFRGTSGAEQDRYGAHLGGKGVDSKNLPESSRLKSSSGSEQDRYASHLGGGIDPKSLPDKSPFAGSSGAEQDRYGSHFGGYGIDKNNLPDRSSFRGASGAEQDRYESHFGGFGIGKKDLPDGASFRGTSGAEQDRYGFKFGVDQDRVNVFSGKKNNTGSGLARFGKNSGEDNNISLNTSTVGILQSTIIPSLGLHSGMSIIAYAAARTTNRLEVKDYLWPSAQVLNAWWGAVGVPVIYHSVPIATALSSLTYTQKLLLGGVTVWGLRLLYRIVGRGVTRGEDDPRYDAVKKEPGFWNNAVFRVFLPEAVFQTLITLPFTVPFRAPWPSAATSSNLPVSAELVHGLAVFLFSAGFATEILADSQLASHQKKDKADLNREGVWSIVRHPK
jgi:steroid 5-alpha reductase family enzyme